MISKVSGGFLVTDLDHEGHEQDHSVMTTIEGAVAIAVGVLRHQAKIADRRARMFVNAARGSIDRLEREEVIEESDAIHFQIHLIRRQLDSLIEYLMPDDEGEEDEQEHDAKPNGLSTEAHKFASAIESIERTNPEAARMFVQAMEQLAGGAL